MPILPQDSQAIREQLLNSSAEFQRLSLEHSRYEAQLEQLSRYPYLSSEDLQLQVMLKKLKLRVKDEMEHLVAQHRRELAPH
jgi:hypothetical protein